MSTTLVSQFYDVSDVLYQRKNLTLSKVNVGCPITSMLSDRKAVGSPVNNFPRARGFSTSALNQSSSSGIISPTSSTSSISSLNDSSNFIMNKPKTDRSLSMGDANHMNNQRNNNINSSRYKTELCRPFEENGHCKYGDKCQFAHGIQELRSLARHPKYKTELCRTYHTIGFCPYGPRCHFIHNEDERRLNHINNLNIKQTGQIPPLQHSQSQPIQRPKSLPFNHHVSLSLSSLSSSESAPSSTSGSPSSLSPTFLDEAMLANHNAMSALYTSLHSQSQSPRPSHGEPTRSLSVLSPPSLDILEIGTSNWTLNNQRNNNNNSTDYNRDEVFSAPPSPPSPADSVSDESCGSPSSSTMDLAKSSSSISSIRLPIFRRFSVEDFA